MTTDYDRSYDTTAALIGRHFAIVQCDTAGNPLSHSNFGQSMRGTRFELVRLAAPDPKSDASLGNVAVESVAVATERHVPLGVATQSTTNRTTCGLSGSRRPALGAEQ